MICGTLARYCSKQSLGRTTTQHDTQIMRNRFRLIYGLENTEKGTLMPAKKRPQRRREKAIRLMRIQKTASAGLPFLIAIMVEAAGFEPASENHQPAVLHV